MNLLHNNLFPIILFFQASMSIPTGLLISQSLRLLPLYVLACLRSVSFGFFIAIILLHIIIAIIFYYFSGWI